MQDFVNLDILIVAVGATVCLLLLIIVVLQARTNHFLKKNLHLFAENNKVLTESIELMAKRAEDFEAEYRQMQNDVALRELYDGASDVYLQAINAARAGVSASEIAESYGITESEAELIVSVHAVSNEAA